jgi:hypothetical protein
MGKSISPWVGTGGVYRMGEGKATSLFERLRSDKLLLCMSKWSFCLFTGTCFFTDTFTSYALHGGF